MAQICYFILNMVSTAITRVLEKTTFEQGGPFEDLVYGHFDNYVSCIGVLNPIIKAIINRSLITTESTRSFVLTNERRFNNDQKIL